MSKTNLYRVSFYNQGQIYEIFAKQVYQSDLWNFLEVEEFVFDTRSEIVIDPSEEKLKTEFASVKRSYIPMHSIVRIDEVSERGTAKVNSIKSSDKIAQIQPFSSAPPIGKD